MQGEPSAAMKNGAREMIAALNLPKNPTTRIAVVSFDDTATIFCQPTNDAALARGCVGRVGASGGTSIASGLQAGINALKTARIEQNIARGDVREIMIVISDGADDAGCGAVQRAAQQAGDEEVHVISVCVGSGCDVKCMRSIASSLHYHFEARSPSQLAGMLDQATELVRRSRTQTESTAISSLAIIVRLPSNVSLVPGSAKPTPSSISAIADHLTWTFTPVARDGVTVTFRLRPLEVGLHAVSVGATGVFTDTSGRVGAFAFDSPLIRVLFAPTVPTPTATATPTNAATASPPPVTSPTTVVTVSPPPVASPTPVAAPTATVRDPTPLLLPIVALEWSR